MQNGKIWLRKAPIDKGVENSKRLLSKEVMPLLGVAKTNDQDELGALMLV